MNRNKFRRWLHYRYLRFLLTYRNFRYAIEHRKVKELDPIQDALYHIVLRLIHNENSDLYFDYLGYTYHIDHDKYLIIIKSMDLTINLIEQITIENCNNFDVMFDEEHMHIIVDNFNREIHKRMTNRTNLRTSRVAKHLGKTLLNISTEQKDKKYV